MCVPQSRNSVDKQSLLESNAQLIRAERERRDALAALECRDSEAERERALRMELEDRIHTLTQTHAFTPVPNSGEFPVERTARTQDASATADLCRLASPSSAMSLNLPLLKPLNTYKHTHTLQESVSGSLSHPFSCNPASSPHSGGSPVTHAHTHLHSRDLRTPTAHDFQSPFGVTSPYESRGPQTSPYESRGPKRPIWTGKGAGGSALSTATHAAGSPFIGVAGRVGVGSDALLVDIKDEGATGASPGVGAVGGVSKEGSESTRTDKYRTLLLRQREIMLGTPTCMYILMYP